MYGFGEDVLLPVFLVGSIRADNVRGILVGGWFGRD
jgi:hypothetical protein